MELAAQERLTAQMRFLLEADRLKSVLRGNSIADESRRENSAEHSWHVALMAMVLAEHCPHPVEICRVVELLIIHDLVEVFAGDTQVYDLDAVKSQADRESVAAAKLFSMLPSDQGEPFTRLWQEFEARLTPEARFARAIDALAPTWLHWGEHANPSDATISASQILAQKVQYLEDYPALFAVLNQVVCSAVSRGLVHV